MKSNFYRILILMGIILGFHNEIHAYITVPSTSYSLKVGVDQYLSVPDAYDGYIDHAVWACSESAISFKEKDAAGAIIQITRPFSGTAVIELLATEKYLDYQAHTRARTYYKQYLITCIGGGGASVDDSEIILPENISIGLGETKNFNILSGNCYNGAFSLKWEHQTPIRFAIYEVNYNTGSINISGAMPGEGVLKVTTANGHERDCKIVVTAPEIVSGRRTEKVAVADIKSLIANILPIAKAAGIENVIFDNDENGNNSVPKNIYNIQGILLKRNATKSDIRALSPGIYIIGKEKIIVR